MSPSSRPTSTSSFKEFGQNIREQALCEAVLGSLTPGQQFIGVVHRELKTLLAKYSGGFNLPLPATVLLVGLQGSGKTTTAAELVTIKRKLKPQTVFLVVDSMTGQEALNVAKTFHERLGLDGVIVSKLDGDAWGGCILSIAGGLGVPIRFVGETPDDLEPFDPDRLSRRILGQGDVVGLAEKAREAFDQRQAERLQKKVIKGGFDLEDFSEQLRGMKKMGRMADLLSMVPGMRQFAGSAEGMDRGFKRALVIIGSMIPDEHRHPNIIKGSRRRRIAAGSGTTVADVNRLLGQYRSMAKAFDGLSGKKGRRMMRRLGIDPSKLGDVLPPGF